MSTADRRRTASSVALVAEASFVASEPPVRDSNRRPVFVRELDNRAAYGGHAHSALLDERRFLDGGSRTTSDAFARSSRVRRSRAATLVDSETAYFRGQRREPHLARDCTRNTGRVERPSAVRPAQACSYVRWRREHLPDRQRHSICPYQTRNWRLNFIDEFYRRVFLSFSRAYHSASRRAQR